MAASPEEVLRIKALYASGFGKLKAGMDAGPGGEVTLTNAEATVIVRYIRLLAPGAVLIGD